MRSDALALGLAVLLTAGAARADFAAGARAYDGGDYPTAFAEWMAIAKAGDPNAQTAIAGMYRFGEGRNPDAAAAVRWYRRAARKGDSVAQMNLGEMYLRGMGARPNTVRAWMWLTRASHQGRKWATERLLDLEMRMTPRQRALGAALLEDSSPDK